MNVRKKTSTEFGGFWFFVLGLYLIFEYVRPQDSYLPFIGPLKLPMILLIILSVLFLQNVKRLNFDRVALSLLILWVYMALWIPFAVNNFHAFQTVKSMSMVFVSVFAIIILIKNEKDIAFIFKLLSFISVLLSIWVLTHGGKGPGGFVRDENDVALVLVTLLPFSFYLARSEHSLKKKILYLTAFLIAIISVITTFSRGGLLGLVAVLGLLILFSKKPVRNTLLAICVSFLLAGVVGSLLPKNYISDMQTITDKEDSTRNLRFLHWTTAIEIYKDNPFFGVGPNNYPWRSGEYFHLSPFYEEGARGRAGRQSHSLYFTLIPELGSLGILLFCLIIFRVMKNLKRVRLQREIESYIDFSKALTCSLMGVLVSGAFISVLYYPLLWHLVGLSVAVHNSLKLKIGLENK